MRRRLKGFCGLQRKRIEIEGIVQGVGFRPFVYQIARLHGVRGWVCNDSRGVMIEAEGASLSLDSFLSDLRDKIPPLAEITRFDVTDCPLQGDKQFVIRGSVEAAGKTARITPDTHVCEACLGELFDPADRRYRYPFINCTHCGPRFSIVTGIPYDRDKSTMVDFAMCDACREEYEDPSSRRFHAQPNACPDCGPQVRLLSAQGQPLLEIDDPVAATAELLRQGRIVAIKGLGGFHLAVDAGHSEAVAELRRRKARDEKPFALMVRDLEAARALVRIDAAEQSLLTSTARPIVLLDQVPDHGLSPLVAPNNRSFGVMLPYTPLHHLLLEKFSALVMTSANISDEPIVYCNDEAPRRLCGIADAYLVHDRRIHTRTDDSIARVLADRPMMLRRSRGYVPRAVSLPYPQPAVLALGAELKNTLCLTQGDRAFLSQHIGDLKNQEVYSALEQSAAHLEEILATRPEVLAHDLHPDYLSTHYAQARDNLPRVEVQHHHAHLASCLADNGVDAPAIGVIFDGIGLGLDGTIWGGEFLVGDFENFRRAGHLACLPMPGGDAATREPRRMALSALLHAYGEDIPQLSHDDGFTDQERRLLQQMVARKLNSPLTSSCGRLFDAVAALAGVRQVVSYEGQGALELEQAIEKGDEPAAYRFEIRYDGDLLICDPAPLIRQVVEDVRAGHGPAWISIRFHNALAQVIAEVCRFIRLQTGLERVVLSGGVFQNRILTEKTYRMLGDEGFDVLLHRQVPPNDGGLALGQAVIAGRRFGKKST